MIQITVYSCEEVKKTRGICGQKENLGAFGKIKKSSESLGIQGYFRVFPLFL